MQKKWKVWFLELTDVMKAQFVGANRKLRNSLFCSLFTWLKVSEWAVTDTLWHRAGCPYLTVHS